MVSLIGWDISDCGAALYSEVLFFLQVFFGGGEIGVFLLLVLPLKATLVPVLNALLFTCQKKKKPCHYLLEVDRFYFIFFNLLTLPESIGSLSFSDSKIRQKLRILLFFFYYGSQAKFRSINWHSSSQSYNLI